jgi:hypothetical protein
MSGSVLQSDVLPARNGTCGLFCQEFTAELHVKIGDTRAFESTEKPVTLIGNMITNNNAGLDAMQKAASGWRIACYSSKCCLEVCTRLIPFDMRQIASHFIFPFTRMDTRMYLQAHHQFVNGSARPLRDGCDAQAHVGNKWNLGNLASVQSVNRKLAEIQKVCTAPGSIQLGTWFHGMCFVCVCVCECCHPRGIMSN